MIKNCWFLQRLRYRQQGNRAYLINANSITEPFSSDLFRCRWKFSAVVAFALPRQSLAAVVAVPYAPVDQLLFHAQSTSSP